MSSNESFAVVMTSESILAKVSETFSVWVIEEHDR